MNSEKRSRFKVITNQEKTSVPIKERQENNYSSGYQTNPMYEKLLTFMNDKKRRFTVEDLLRW